MAMQDLWTIVSFSQMTYGNALLIMCKNT